MRFSATALLLAAAMGVSAHPSGHAHRNAHRALEARTDFVIAQKPAPPQPSPPAPAPKPDATPTQADAIPSNTPQPSSPPGSGYGGPGYKPFCGGNTKRATLAEIAYKGNVGAPGNYGCNLMIVDAGVANQYNYTATFVNKGNSAQEGKCWLKIGPDNKIDGFFKNMEALTFSVPANGQAVLAIDGNSQGACAFGSPSVPTTPIGQFAATWFEFDMGNESNKYWSGADASCLVSAAAGVDIPAMQVCAPQDPNTKCSTIYAGGKGVNAYLAGMEVQDGVGYNFGPGNVRLTVTI